MDLDKIEKAAQAASTTNSNVDVTPAEVLEMVRQIRASKDLANHLVGRIETCADFQYYMGFGTRSRELLVAACAALFDRTPADLKKRFERIKHDREPDVVVLRRERDELQTQLDGR